MPLQLSNFTLDPQNGAASFTFVKITGEPGTLPHVGMNVKLPEGIDNKTVAETRKIAAIAAASLLTEVIQELSNL